jgi:hypothetical protein
MKHIISIAELISLQIRMTGKSVAEVSREVGFNNPNFLSMIRRGKTKIPLNRVPALAKALEICPRGLLFRCLEEYEPELLETIQICLPGAFLSESDLKIVRAIRKKIAARQARGESES